MTLVMPIATLDAKKIAIRFAQAGTGHAQAEVLREAFDERDQAYEEALQEQARALKILQELVHKFQVDAGQVVTKTEAAEQVKHQEERADSKFGYC